MSVLAIHPCDELQHEGRKSVVAIKLSIGLDSEFKATQNYRVRPILPLLPPCTVQETQNVSGQGGYSKGHSVKWLP